jgi:drug/metabolite transporter (DMT)-like permease
MNTVVTAPSTVAAALFVLALGLLLYPWHDKPKQQRSRFAAYLALGAGSGLVALGFYLTHAGISHVWPFAAGAVIFPVLGTRWWARREK